ncbi:CobW/HypB/UreG, nucleotide-binding domain [Candidatus Bilamarchaeum dharawalense]|uniref:CobW/HypB/UreG, nucleotide-binding domain n=1 Tax=Candidatus Bilamarchaeum dharawalense TaxID=2885759 RepID=A0A5E4LN40_9ARCH|nr:CobW/HypB/UreG, nucleotide-binding domain [Candidatus Bilamarchaeum dharawalense]
MDIPITVVTGYLGAGKTTLLRKIIDESKMKIAILMNEFGTVAIDGKIIEGKNIKIAEMAGGCVCCSLAGEFKAAIEEIRDNIKPDWMIVETTGVAEPSALAFDIMEGIAGTRLDAIVTIVDADALTKFLTLGHTGTEQIELADVLVVNKVDLVEREKLVEIKQRLTNMNNRAAQIETTYCNVDLSFIFGVEREQLHVSTHGHKPEFEYFDFVSDKKLDYDKFIEFYAKLPNEIYRSKGFIVTNKGSFLVNYVGGRYGSEGFNANKTELVFIGNNIKKHEDEVKKCLTNLLME